jgi:putative iron-dependent peroxidase
MTTAQLAQTGILETIPTQARYLSFQLRLGTDPKALLQQLATQTDGSTMVVGLGEYLVNQFGASVPGLRTFRGIEGSKIKLPASSIDLLVWLRGHARGELLIRSQQLEAMLTPAFDVTDIRDAFNDVEGRDLTGYEDGTENPKDDEALVASLVTEGSRAPVGSSFLALQRWHHQLDRFQAMPRQQRDHTFGRDLDSNEELDDAPESAHVKRTAQESFVPEAFVLRRSMPWAEGNQGGLVFTAFGHSFDAFEALLGRMCGAEDGITDALFTFSEPETGAYFWCPPMHNGQLDLRALGI